MIKFLTWDRNSFQKKLHQSSIFNDTENVNVNDIKAMLMGTGLIISQGFQDSTTRTPEIIHNRLYDFMAYTTKRATSIKVKLKVLVSCHILLVDCKINKSFSKIFLEWDGFKSEYL
jgi:hypothetical protein